MLTNIFRRFFLPQHVGAFSKSRQHVGQHIDQQSCFKCWPTCWHGFQWPQWSPCFLVIPMLLVWHYTTHQVQHQCYLEDSCHASGNLVIYRECQEFERVFFTQ